MYEGGYGVPQEPKTALLYYTKATRYQCPEAYIKLGDCFKNGFGVEQNSKDAIRNYQKASDALPEANVYIGYLVIYIDKCIKKGIPILNKTFNKLLIIIIMLVIDKFLKPSCALEICIKM